MKIVRVPIDKLRPNPWNMNRMSDDMYRKLVSNLKKSNAPVCILTRMHPTKKGFYQIVDGEHRWRAAKELGWSEIDVAVEQLTDAQAKTLTINLNYLRGTPDPSKLESAVAAIVRGIGERKANRLLPYTQVEISDMVRMAEETKKEVQSRVEKCVENHRRTKGQRLPSLMLELGPYSIEEYREIQKLLKPKAGETEGQAALRMFRSARGS